MSELTNGSSDCAKRVTIPTIYEGEAVQEATAFEDKMNEIFRGLENLRVSIVRLETKLNPVLAEECETECCDGESKQPYHPSEFDRHTISIKGKIFDLRVIIDDINDRCVL